MMDVVIRNHALDIRYSQDVWRLRRQVDGSFLLHVGPDRIVRTRRVVLAVGVMGKPRKPDYPIPPAPRSRVHFSTTEPWCSVLRPVQPSCDGSITPWGAPSRLSRTPKRGQSVWTFSPGRSIRS